MALFRPLNSAESNLYTIRVSVDNFNTLVDSTYIVSNNSTYSSTNTYLTSPTYNLLPKDFYIQYVSSNQFLINYGKTFTQLPNIHITPIFSSSPVLYRIVKTSTTTTVYFIDYLGAAVSPSTDGTSGFLGFDLTITGPVKIGITTGNSNKGWATNDDSNVYSFMDISLGSGYTVNDSIVMSKNLKLLDGDGNIKQYTTTTSTLDYTHTTWLIDGGIALTTLTPVKGMLLIISSTDTDFDDGTNVYNTNPTITTNTGVVINYGTLNTIEFSQRGDSIILYGTSSTNFVVINKSSTITLSTV